MISTLYKVTRASLFTKSLAVFKRLILSKLWQHVDQRSIFDIIRQRGISSVCLVCHGSDCQNDAHVALRLSISIQKKGIFKSQSLAHVAQYSPMFVELSIQKAYLRSLCAMLLQPPALEAFTFVQNYYNDCVSVYGTEEESY